MESLGSNTVRRERVRTQISERIEILERYRLNNVPRGAYVPESMAEFRKWEDEVLGLTAISSPNPLNRKASPQNRDLIERAAELIAYFRRIGKRASPKSESLSASSRRANGEVTELQKKVASLGSSIHELRHELASLKEEAQTKDAEIARLKRDLTALRRRFPGGAPHLVSVE